MQAELRVRDEPQVASRYRVAVAQHGARAPCWYSLLTSSMMSFAVADLDAGENRLRSNDGADGQNEHIPPAVESQAPACTREFAATSVRICASRSQRRQHDQLSRPATT